MKFKINNCNWEIKEMSQSEIRDMFTKNNCNIDEFGMYFGVTFFNDQTILIDESLCKERKIITLIHELMHCYIGSFAHHIEKQFSEEDVCDYVANSHFIIADIIKQYCEVLNGEQTTETGSAITP